MSEQTGRAGRRGAQQRAQALAKLHALERLHLAGLVDERTYAARLARLQADVDAAEAVESLSSWASASAPAAPPAAAPAAPPAATPPPAAAGAAPPAVAPARPRHTWLLAGAAAAVVAAGAAAVLLVRAHSTAGSPAAVSVPAHTARPTAAATFDPVRALAAQRSAARVSAGAVIDPRTAERLVHAVWPVREEILAAHDAPAIRELETGPAAAADTAVCSRGCPASREPRPLDELRVFVPRQAEYPAAFLAEVLTTVPGSDTPAVERLVFTRASARSLWSVALASRSDGTQHIPDAPQTEPTGFDRTPPTFAQLPAATDLPATLAGDERQWALTGAAPQGSLFAPGPYTDAAGRALWQQVQQDARVGNRDTAAYTTDVDHDGVWTFATSVVNPGGLSRLGWSITCGTVHYRIDTESAGAPVIQPPDRSRFGVLLSPGSYSRVSVTGVQQVCIEEQPRFASLVVASLGATDTEVAGVPLR